ncbi:MAG TPA: family 20 glycosylhydrolase, partial [Yinghuangia sp.]|nr:family 20 glycosylhydrolase [Yinghuangia sp.]
MDAVIPAPANRTQAAAAPSGVLSTDGPWLVRASDPALEPVAATVQALLEPHLADATAADGPGNPQTITLRFGDTVEFPEPHGIALGGNEAHHVVLDHEGITCRAGTAAGVFRAAVTAVQLIATGGKPPYQEVADAPRYAWRGLVLDPARSFIPVADLCRLIDLAALYKLNVLHLHLTDNQGWRLEIPGLPELTAQNAPFYTADEFREVQEHAAARFITVIPEIDLPGHCGALRAALPHLPAAPVPDDGAELLEHLNRVMPFAPPLDLADAATSDVVRRILEQVCAMTAGPFVHIGADEAAGTTHDSYNGA